MRPTTILGFLVIGLGPVWTASAAGLELHNTDFRQVQNGQFVGWEPVGRYVVDGNTARVECTSAEQQGGLVQVVRCNPPVRRPFTASARAKAIDVGQGGDFAVWLDLIHADGTPSWAHVAGFARGSHDWQTAAIEVVPSKPVAEIRFHLLLRHVAGKAWFDQPKLFNTPVAFRQAQAVVGLWGFDSLSLRAQTNLPATIEVQGLSLPTASQPAASRPATMLLFDQPHAPHHVLAGPIVLTASVIGDPENRTRFELKPQVIAPQDSPPFRTWATDVTTRIFTDTLCVPANNDDAIIIEAVRGGHASVQVAVAARPQGSTQQIDVVPGEFTSDTGGKLPSDGWQRFRVGFIRNEQPARHPCLEHEGPAWWPDPLLTWTTMRVPAGQVRSAVLDLHVPVHQTPGLYQGHISVTNGAGAATRLAVQVRVHPFVMPRTLRIKTAFALMDGFIEKIYGKITPELRRAYTRFVLDHHLNPDDISRTALPDLDELAWAKEHGLNAFNILNLVPEPKQKVPWVCFVETRDYTPAFKQRLIERLDAFVPELEKRGLLDMAYVYGFDERGPEYIPIMREYFGLIKQRYPRIRTLSTCWPPDGTDPATLSIDWYCPLSNKYDAVMADKVRARGGEMWWYICMGPTWPYANWLFEYPLIESRIIWWQTWQQKVDGFLYWGLNIWDRPHNERPILDDADALLDWSVTPFEPLHGDGVLLYPGEKGPLGSLRLLSIRDGLADTAILDAAVARVGRAKVEQIVNTVSRGVTDFTRDLPTLQAARRQLLAIVR